MMMMMMPFLLLELPSELFLHILIRLPLKYLMRLRCVSKFFLDLTNNPNFITSYRRLHCTKSNPPNHLLPLDDFNFMETSPHPPPSPVRLLSKSNQWPPWRFHMLFKGSNFIYLQKRHELIPFHRPSTKRLISCINGLICCGETDSLEIYNIFAGTNYYIIAPRFDPPPTWDPVFTFGYDPISNDYKILIIEHYRSWLIYSFATNSWKPMTLYTEYSTLILNSEGGRTVCINGVIYWPPGHRDHSPYYDKIVMFDLHIEKFGLIKLPKEDLLLPTQYQDIQLLSFRGCLAFAIIRRTSTTTTTTTRKRMRSGGRGGGGGEKATHHGDGGEIWVELFTLNLFKETKFRLKKKASWNRQSFVVPIPSPTKKEEVEIVSCCDEIFLGWLESNQLRLYNLHTKHIFNLPLSPPSHYYPKASFMEKKKDNPTYVDNLSFDFSLI